MSSRPDRERRRRATPDTSPDPGTTGLAIATGFVASALLVTAPLASGGLLDVVAATAAGTPQRSLPGPRPVSAWADGITAWFGALAYLLPGAVIFGGVAVWVASTHSLGPETREGVSWGVAAAMTVYTVAASALASAAVVEFAVRRRPAGMFDVTGLLDRLILRRGFGVAWVQSAGLVGVALAIAILAWRTIPLPPLAAVMLGSATLFLAEVPAGFIWGAFAHDAYGLLACVPDAQAPAPRRDSAALSPRP